MAKRNESVLDIFLFIPWWVNTCLAVIAFCLFRVLFPIIHFKSPALQGFATVAPTLGNVLTFLFVLGALASGLTAFLKARRHDIQPDAVQKESTLTSSSQNTCPHCGATMVLRTATQGEYAGQQFWGCSNFPNCRHVEEYAHQ